MFRRWAAFLGLLSILSAAVLVGSPSGAGADSPPVFTSADGLTVLSANPVGEREWQLTVATAALSQPVRVTILLPVGYSSSTARYPVLYLYHGTSGGANDWVDSGNATAATAPYPVIVVMPDAGYNGNGGSWFTNWWDQHTSLGVADWETFHVGQLVPWVDANLRTVADRDGRAVAGLSQGGFGSFSYAARHPDMFVSVASFSGAPDIASNALVQAAAATIIEGTATGLDGVEPDAMFGDPAADRINWQGHDPASLVTNLADTQLELWSGNGQPGPLDTPSTQIVGDALVEGAAHYSSVFFAQTAKKAHVAFTFDDYGRGTHSWPYWSRDLTQYLPAMMATFDNPPAAPSAITYKSVDRTWTQWGWQVSVTRAQAQAFSGLVGASAAGYTISTKSPATVTTPAVYAPGATFTVTARGGKITSGATAVADSAGSLSIATKPGSGHNSMTVTITPA
jgi:S-formylglutathione hydrolase FrmB